MSDFAFKPDPKPRSEGGIGKKKRSRKASPHRIAEVREKKLRDGCRICKSFDNLHAHHVVRRGSPWFGQWTENCIVGLCAACHGAIHDGDKRTRLALRVLLTDSEVKYGDDRAYPGYVDDEYGRLRPAGTNPGTLEAVSG